VKKKTGPSLGQDPFFSLLLLDELRTFCFENKIEETPALLAV
jgi:hypothetical protein